MLPSLSERFQPLSEGVLGKSETPFLISLINIWHTYFVLKQVMFYLTKKPVSFVEMCATEPTACCLAS